MLTMLIWFGVFMEAAAIIVAVLAEGDVLRLCAYLLLAVGSSTFFVGLTGWAVLLGLRAHAEES